MVQSLAACQRARLWTPNCSEWLLHRWVSGYKVLRPTSHEVHHSGCCIKQPFTKRPDKTLSHYLLEQFCFFWLLICVTEQQELLVGEVLSRRLTFKCQNIKLTGLLSAQEDRGSLFLCVSVSCRRSMGHWTPKLCDKDPLDTCSIFIKNLNRLQHNVKAW